MITWNNLSYEQWSAENEKRWNEFKDGIRMIVIPEDAMFIKTDFGSKFIEVQSNAMLDEEPGLFVRSCHYGPALKVMVPDDTKPGDMIRVVRKSQSGKSLIAEIVK